MRIIPHIVVKISRFLPHVPHFHFTFGLVTQAPSGYLNFPLVLVTIALGGLSQMLLGHSIIMWFVLGKSQ
jgi:hypothetical protein